MKILHINTDGAIGGAAKVALRLASAQRALGHQVQLLVGHLPANLENVELFPFPTGTLSATTYRLIRRPLDAAEQFSGLQYLLRPSASVFLRHPAVQRADLLHFHNTHGEFLNPFTVASASRAKPVVWTLHDEWSFTGHCACTIGCERWKTGCGSCPDLRRYPRLRWDTTAMLWRLKRRAYDHGDRLTITTPSYWLLDEVAESILRSFPRHHVANAVDPSIFHPVEKAQARAALGLGQDKFIVMFAASSGSENPWKGFQFLIESLKILSQKNGQRPYLLVIGNRGSLPGIELESRWEGMITEEHAMATYYSAADLFLLPSLTENSPLTVIEALACGTPVVAFDVGGIGELVHHKDTGYLARYRDASDLAAGVNWIMNLSGPERQQLREKGLRLVAQHHTLKQQAAAFETIYETLIRSAE